MLQKRAYKPLFGQCKTHEEGHKPVLQKFEAVTGLHLFDGKSFRCGQRYLRHKQHATGFTGHLGVHGEMAQKRVNKLIRRDMDAELTVFPPDEVWSARSWAIRMMNKLRSIPGKPGTPSCFSNPIKPTFPTRGMQSRSNCFGRSSSRSWMN